MSNESLLQLDTVSSGYGKKTIIREVSLDVPAGKIVTLLGANGVGKTTTLRTITGQIAPFAGRLLFQGRDISGLKPHSIAGLGVGYSPEGRRIFGNLTAYENLLVVANRIKSKKIFRENLQWVYTLFPRLGERSHQLSDTMSGGEQQMLAIGRALVSKPMLLLLDEPSLGLAPMVVKQIAETLVEINQAGVSILLVEQNAKMALQISHYAYVMDNGQVIQHGSCEELLQDKSIADIYLGIR
ncbi:MAG: ABC transporter ATP-binding protein [Desulfohalobiaceae bacterium]|nr:ABC transporter ATP-binding protein [Desulfohalobiaceae bacterium]